MTYFFETYGCQMNLAESAAFTADLKERGWLPAENGADADLVLLNTCSVRITAEERVFGRIAHYVSVKKKLLAAGGGAPALVVAGCMAQRLGEGLKEKYPLLDYVMGTAAKSSFPLILQDVERRGGLKGNGGGGQRESDLSESPAFSFSRSHIEEGKFSSFVPIMHGCDNFCSYCIVPYVRGREVSRSPKEVLDEINLAAGRGIRDVTLLGQNVNSYVWQDEGGSRKLDFAGLLELAAREAAKTGLSRLRFLSANPANFSDAATRVMAENPCFCRHLHLPVQSGSDAVLEAMRRGYGRERYLQLAASIRSAMPDMSFSTDILVGFPGETDEDFQMTLSLMEEVKFSYAYMYHFNPREGTAAYSLPGRISEEVKRARLSQVIELQKKHTKELLKKRLGSNCTVLIEGISRKNADELIARTEKDEMVVVPGPASLTGSFAQVNLRSLRGNTFRAKELSPCPGV
ncbi:MAG: tRNA (N6-isopentenyl adenosine(37)-C2)-methylthiotransferase MiaB [Spirochaetes bacterium]|nr:tRNA (N6-isopentenyl adenosine(37)-C2)-methylthiotransferase MiaB [Spirochaetota bacterium]